MAAVCRAGAACKWQPLKQQLLLHMQHAEAAGLAAYLSSQDRQKQVLDFCFHHAVYACPSRQHSLLKTALQDQDR